MFITKLLTWIGETFSSRKKIIVNDPCGAGVYLTRYYLIGRDSSKGGLMLHHIHRSDMDRDLHDHPWAFWSLILTGGYFEETPLGTGRLRQRIWYSPGRLLRRPAKWIHRIIVLNEPETEVWTLVWRTGYQRRWGFHTRKGWVWFKDYDYKAGCE